MTQHFPDTIRPALQVIKPRPGLHKVSGMYVMVTRRGDMYFLADCTVNIEPTAEDLAEIALCAAETARRFNVEPRVAMLSFSNFGSTSHPLTVKVRRAVEMRAEADPTLMIDGEMMAETAVVPEIIEETYPFSKLRGGANVLIFPDLTSANTCYKLLATNWRSGDNRADPDGHVETGARIASRGGSGRDRQYGGDCGCRCAGN